MSEDLAKIPSIPLPSRPAWHAEAACRGMGPDAFYSVDRDDDRRTLGDESDIAHFKRAKAICESCPVQKPCADWGRKYEKYGVWGGVSAAERKRQRKTGMTRLVECVYCYRLFEQERKPSTYPTICDNPRCRTEASRRATNAKRTRDRLATPG